MKQSFFASALIFLFIIITSLFATTYKNNINRKEGFSYNDCRNKGFTSEFCVQTPIATAGVGTCLCDNGDIGIQLPGFGGECVCGMALGNPLYR